MNPLKLDEIQYQLIDLFRTPPNTDYQKKFTVIMDEVKVMRAQEGFISKVKHFFSRTFLKKLSPDDPEAVKILASEAVKNLQAQNPITTFEGFSKHENGGIAHWAKETQRLNQIIEDLMEYGLPNNQEVFSAIYAIPPKNRILALANTQRLLSKLSPAALSPEQKIKVISMLGATDPQINEKIFNLLSDFQPGEKGSEMFDMLSKLILGFKSISKEKLMNAPLALYSESPLSFDQKCDLFSLYLGMHATHAQSFASYINDILKNLETKPKAIEDLFTCLNKSDVSSKIYELVENLHRLQKKNPNKEQLLPEWLSFLVTRESVRDMVDPLKIKYDTDAMENLKKIVERYP